MLIEHPHDLAGIHGGAAADGQNQVRLESRHLGRALPGAGKGRIGGHIVEGGVGDAHFVQLVFNGLRVAVIVQEAVRDDKCLFMSFQLGQGDGQAALFEIDLFRRTEPEHVFPPDGDGFDVQQMLDAHVLGHGVAAPASAAQGEGGGQLEVVQVADAALSGGGIHQNPAGFHPGGEGVQLLLCADGIQVDGGGVTVAAVLDQGVGLIQSIRKILCPVHGKNRGELFVGEGLAQVGGGNFTDENFGTLRYLHPCQGSNGVGGLADDFGVQGAVDKNGGADFVGFLFIQNVAAPVDKLGLDLVINAAQYHHALLRGADHTVVKGFGVDDGGYCQQNVGGFVNHSGGVARAHTQGGLTGRISGFYHAGTAGGQDNIGLLHELVGQLQTGNIDPADNTLGSACGHGGLQYYFGGGNGAAFGPGVRADDDAVAGLQRDQGFKNRSGSGIGGGDHSGNDADGLRDFLNTVSSVFLNDTAGLGILVSIINVLRGVVIFDDLVFHHTHSGLGHGLLCQRDPHLIGGACRGQEDPIHLLLGIGSKPGLRSAAAVQRFGQFLGVCYRRIVLLHMHSPF